MDYLKEHHWSRQTNDNHNLNVAACRLIMNLIPGLETTVIFESVSKFVIYNISCWKHKNNFFSSMQMINLFKSYSLGQKILMNHCKLMQQEY